MDNRRIKLIFTNIQLVACNTYEIGKVLSSLPARSKLVGSEYSNNASLLSFIISNDKFKECDISCHLPKFYCELNKSGQLITDLNGAFDDKYTGISSFDRTPQSASSGSPPTTLSTTGENFTWDDIDFNTPVYPDDFCSHSWVNYSGLTETYEFCQHCDQKRDI